MSYKSEQGEFKGNKTISIMRNTEDGDKRVISFGIKKAQAILSQYEEIKKFVEENTANEDNNQ